MPKQGSPAASTSVSPGVRSDDAIRRVGGEIAVSSGSACASATSEPSRVLTALGLHPDVAATGVRISLGRYTTEDDVDAALSALSKIPSIEVPA